jgi:MFS family permease
MSIDSSPSAEAVRQSRRSERLLVPATFITTAGNAFQITAATVLVFRASHTTLSVGWLFIAVSIPQVAFSLLFGRLVDKFDRRALSITADVVSAASAFALPAWLWLGGPTTVGSYIANFLLAVTAALFMPASNALVKERVLDQRLGTFNSRFEMANNAGMLGASALAGFLVVWFGATPLFVFNSLTFVASAILTYLIGPKLAIAAPTAEAVEAAESASAPAEEARPVQRTDQPVRRLALLFANLSLGLLVANTILATLILHTFHKGPWLIGVTDALAGVGFLTGAACYPWISKRVSGLNLAVYGTLGNLVLFCIQPLHYIALIACIPFAGFCFAQSRIAARTLLMRASPVDRVGRIFGSTNALGLAAGIAANLVLSVLADRTSVPNAFWALAAIQAAIAIGTYLSLVKPLSTVDKKPAEVLEATAA